MKIRRGFVSNSSSSSFIIGCAKVKDFEKVMKYLKDEEIYDKVKVYSTSQLSSAYEGDFVNGNFVVEGRINYPPTVEIQIDSSEKDYYLIVNISNHEGDDAFYDSRMQELDYDIVEDYFPDEQQKILKLFKKENLLDAVDYKIGAGRDD